MFRPLFWAIIRSQLNLRKLYSVIYKINYTVQFPQIQFDMMMAQNKGRNMSSP